MNINPRIRKKSTTQGVCNEELAALYILEGHVVSVQPHHQCLDTVGCLAEWFLQDGSQWFVVILDMHRPSICILVETLKPKHQWQCLDPSQFVPISALLGWVPSMQTQLACHPEELLPQDRLCCCLLAALVFSLGQSMPVHECWWLSSSQHSVPHHTLGTSSTCCPSLSMPWLVPDHWWGLAWIWPGTEPCHKVLELCGHQLVVACWGLLQPSTNLVGLLLMKSCGPWKRSCLDGWLLSHHSTWCSFPCICSGGHWGFQSGPFLPQLECLHVQLWRYYLPHRWLPSAHPRPQWDVSEKSHCLLTAQRVIVPSETCQREWSWLSANSTVHLNAHARKLLSHQAL